VKILDAVTVHREGLERQVVELELQLEEQIEKLEATAGRYNKAAAQLQLIPATAKRASGIEYEMSINRSAPVHGMLSVDLKVDHSPIRWGWHGCCVRA
jgi:kinetochore protein NDC80